MKRLALFITVFMVLPHLLPVLGSETLPAAESTAIDESGAGNLPAADNGSDAAADVPDLLLAHRKAMGGADAIKAAKTLRMTVHLSMMMLEGSVETLMAAPAKNWTRIDTNVMAFTEASDGSTRWKMDQNGQLTTRRDDRVLEHPAPVLSDFQYLFPNPEITVVDAGTETIDDKTYRVLEIDAPGFKKTRRKYLDPETLLCVREDAEEEGISVVMTYSDFQVVDGIPMAGKTLQQPQIPGLPPTTLTLEELVFNAPIEMSVFDPPAGEHKDYTFPESHAVTVPMRRHGDHMIIGVSINGQGPFDFLLDSGAATTIIDNRFADELGLERTGGMHAVGIGGAESIDKVSVDTLAVDEFVIDTLDLFCMDMQAISQMLGMDETFKGIVGYDLFARAVMKMDYPGGTLTLIDPDTFEYDGPGKPVPGEIINNLICVDGTIDGDLHGKIRIDTGAAGGLHLHAGYLREHGLLDRYSGDVEMEMFGAGGKQTIQLVKVNSLKLGDFEVREPVSTLMLGEDGAEGIMGTLDAMATAGTEVLSRFVVYFDYARNRLILEPTERTRVAGRMNRAGLMLVEDADGRIFVGAVLKGSPGDDAGFKEGDEILKLEKLRPGDGLTADLANRMLYASEGVTFDFKIRRKDARMKLELTLRDLVK